ncbi:glycosyltransferase family 2 protein [Hydrogenophaga sp. 5NK40-0174]|uniref:glycosyltransferase family 2 protein n=1 Tax=Hydrogenophaga sp. 5NK40-0174 TaxID=3127649 RepID=UPI0031027DAA
MSNACSKPLISISIPVLNEAGNLPVLYERLDSLAHKMENHCEMEFLFTDNRSEDGTWEQLKELSKRDPRVRAMRFSKNFGFQNSILANYLHTRGDAVLQIDADLQDPPELLEQFFELWQQGYKVVYGVRIKRPDGFFLATFRRFGYWLIDKLSEHEIPRDAGDFRLIDRSVVKAIAQSKSASPYIRGQIAGMGFQQIGVPYARDARLSGKSKFNLSRLLRLGITAVFNHSTIPLRAATFLGVGILVLSLLGTAYYLALYALDSTLPRGFTSIQLMILFGIGLNAFFLGIIGEYILRIYRLMRSDPIAIVDECLNINTNDLKL